MLKDADMNQETLGKYSAIIVGIRAYNTLDRINFYHDHLMEYVKNGGNVIVQYNTNSGLKTNPGPYPMKVSADRVTVEGAEVRVLSVSYTHLDVYKRQLQQLTIKVMKTTTLLFFVMLMLC